MSGKKRYFVYEGYIGMGYVITEGKKKLCWTPYPVNKKPVDISNWSIKDVLENYPKELKKEEFYLWLSLM